MDAGVEHDLPAYVPAAVAGHRALDRRRPARLLLPVSDLQGMEGEMLHVVLERSRDHIERAGGRIDDRRAGDAVLRAVDVETPPKCRIGHTGAEVDLPERRVAAGI